MELALEFQKEVLKYLVQDRKNRYLIKELDPAVFDLEEHQLVFSLVKKYLSKYNKQPLRVDFLQWVQKSLTKTSWDEDIVKLVISSAKMLYKPIEASEELLRDTVVEFVQYQMAKVLLAKYAPKLKEGVGVWANMRDELNDILRLEKNEGSDHARPTSLFTEWDEEFEEVAQTYPCYLPSLNRLTSKKGFASPELILILGLPKGFKTGVMINFAVNYAIDGLKIYVADFENGQREYRERIKQALMHDTREKVKEGYDSEFLDECLTRWSGMGGDIIVGSYTAYEDGVIDVEADLQWLKDTKGFVPDMIVWDYPDIMNTKEKEKEARNRISRAYHEIIGLHKKLECFGFAASHTKQSAIGKFNFDIGDFSEDWGKAKNCHATFGIMQNEADEAAGIGRLGVVLQRSGAASGTVFVEIDKETQTMREINMEDYQTKSE